MSDDARLERIEKKLDQVGDAIVALARMEERMITLFKRMDALGRGHTNRKRHRRSRDRVGTMVRMLRFAERVFWIVVTGAIALWHLIT